MQRLLRWLVPLGLASILAAGTANAATVTATWPATCELDTNSLVYRQCVDRHLNNLDARVRAQGTLLAAARSRIAQLRTRDATLAACLAEYPASRTSTYDNWYYPFYNSQLSNASEAPGYYNDYSYGAQLIPDLLQQTQSGGSVDYWLVRDTCGSAVYSRPPTP